MLHIYLTSCENYIIKLWGYIDLFPENTALKLKADKWRSRRKSEHSTLGDTGKLPLSTPKILWTHTVS